MRLIWSSLSASRDNERGAWAKSAKDTGNDFSGSADFQASWCSKKKKTLLFRVNYSETFGPRCKKEKKTQTILLQRTTWVVLERGEKIWNINHATCIKSYARRAERQRGKRVGWGGGGVKILHFFKNRDRKFKVEICKLWFWHMTAYMKSSL